MTTWISREHMEKHPSEHWNSLKRFKNIPLPKTHPRKTVFSLAWRVPGHEYQLSFPRWFEDAAIGEDHCWQLRTSLREGEHLSGLVEWTQHRAESLSLERTSPAFPTHPMWHVSMLNDQCGAAEALGSGWGAVCFYSTNTWQMKIWSWRLFTSSLLFFWHSACWKSSGPFSAILRRPY